MADVARTIANDLVSHARHDGWQVIRLGTLRLVGPAELLAQPTDAEIADRFAATTWRIAFNEAGARSDHRLGLIETRVQLDYICAQVWMRQSFPSYASEHGLGVEAFVKPGSSPPRERKVRAR